MKKLISGLSPEDTFCLYAFVKAYENIRIEDYPKDDDLFAKYPKLEKLNNDFLAISFCGKDNSKAIELLDINGLKDNQMYGLRHGSPLRSFLYHLRNSIAHAYISKREDNDRIIVRDKSKDKWHKLTAIGILSSIDIINIFTNTLNLINYEEE